MSQVPEEHRGDRISWLLVAVGALSVLAGVALIGSAVAVLSLSNGTTIADAERSLREAGCTVKAYPATTARHFTDLNKKVAYNSNPPTNGDHYYLPAVFGLHREPLNPRQLVHNLEHGGVAFLIGKRVSNQSRQRLTEFYFEDRNAVVIAPLPALGRNIALTAWVTGPDVPAKKPRYGAGYVVLCPEFDEKAFADFRSAFRYRGPESKSPEHAGFEPQDLEPGL